MKPVEQYRRSVQLLPQLTVDDPVVTDQSAFTTHACCSVHGPRRCVQITSLTLPCGDFELGF
jgi:hypothetical protein